MRQAIDRLALFGVKALLCVVAIVGVSLTMAGCAGEAEDAREGHTVEEFGQAELALATARPDNRWLWVCADGYSAANAGPSSTVGHPGQFQWPQNGSREWAQAMGEWLKGSFPQTQGQLKAGDVAYADSVGTTCPLATPFQPIGGTGRIDIRVRAPGTGGSLGNEVEMARANASTALPPYIRNGNFRLMTAGIIARRNLLGSSVTTRDVEFWAVCRAFGYLQGLAFTQATDSCMGSSPTTPAQLTARSTFSATEWAELFFMYQGTIAMPSPAFGANEQ